MNAEILKNELKQLHTHQKHVIDVLSTIIRKDGEDNPGREMDLIDEVQFRQFQSNNLLNKLISQL